MLVSQLLFFCFSVVENEYAIGVDAVAVAVEPEATTVAAAWGFGLCQLSDVGKGQLNSEKTPFV